MGQENLSIDAYFVDKLDTCPIGSNSIDRVLCFFVCHYSPLHSDSCSLSTAISNQPSVCQVSHDNNPLGSCHQPSITHAFKNLCDAIYACNNRVLVYVMLVTLSTSCV